MLIAGAGASAVAASTAVLLSQDFWVVAAAQVFTAVAGCAVAPAVNGLSLGLVRQSGFNRQTSFLILGAFALASIALWLMFGSPASAPARA